MFGCNLLHELNFRLLEHKVDMESFASSKRYFNAGNVMHESSQNQRTGLKDDILHPS